MKNFNSSLIRFDLVIFYSVVIKDSLKRFRQYGALKIISSLSIFVNIVVAYQPLFTSEKKSGKLKLFWGKGGGED